MLYVMRAQVYIIHRRNEFRASKVMQKRALEHEKIKVGWPRREGLSLCSVHGRGGEAVWGALCQGCGFAWLQACWPLIMSVAQVLCLMNDE